MTETNNKLLKTAILTMSMVQMGTNGIGPILADISKAFPGTSDTTVQFLMTFPILFTMILELISAKVSEKLPAKLLAIAGLVTIGAAGILAVLFHGSLAVLFVWGAVLGIGLGLVAPIAPGLINERFDGKEKLTMLGWQNSASTIGSMIMTFACGFLAVIGWNYGYLVYLICVPGIIFTLIGLKEKPKKEIPKTKGNPGGQEIRKTAEKPEFRLVIWRDMLIACLFLMLYSAIPANISMLVAEKGAGDTSVAGILTTVFSLAGMLAGLVFGVLTGIFRKYTNTVGACVMAAGAFLMGIASGLPVMIIGCILAGASMSLVMAVCMGAASLLPGYETINSALILASTSVGIFITPLLTSLTAVVTGSDAVFYRFFALAIIGIVLAVITVILKKEKKKRRYL